MRTGTLPVMIATVVLAGCARAALISAPSVPAPSPKPSFAEAIEARIADLAARGGDCEAYGAVLNQSYKSGRITVRQYMWRVGAHLTSGEAHPDGEIALAKEIDSLNVGVRTITEMTWTAEHEAVHLAFHIASHSADDEASVNAHVRACRAAS